LLLSLSWRSPIALNYSLFFLIRSTILVIFRNFDFSLYCTYLYSSLLLRQLVSTSWFLDHITASLHPVVIQSVLHISFTPFLHYQSSVIDYRHTNYAKTAFHITLKSYLLHDFSPLLHCITASRCNSFGPAYNSYALSLLSIIRHRALIINHRSSAH